MAKVKEMLLSAYSFYDTLVPYLRDNWTWGATYADDGKFYIDTAKTIGIQIGAGGQYNDPTIRILFNGAEYHVISFDRTTWTNDKAIMIEITNTALIISCTDKSTSANAANCQKIIVCNGHNTNTGTDEQIMIYLDSRSSANVSAMYASDVAVPVDMSEQNGNANVNAKTTNLIPLYNTNSAFITTDVYKSLCEDIGAWYFGNVMVNDKAYRMSGSVFALDE